MASYLATRFPVVVISVVGPFRGEGCAEVTVSKLASYLATRFPVVAISAVGPFRGEGCAEVTVSKLASWQVGNFASLDGVRDKLSE